MTLFKSTLPRVAAIARTFIGLSALAASMSAFAAYPDKPIKLIVGYTAGGAYDTATRIIARRLEAHLGVPVVIENKAGAAGTIADKLVAGAAPDGYTLLSGGSSGALIATRRDYTAYMELAPLMRYGALPITLSALKTAPFKTLPVLIAYAKANPGKLNYGHAGLNSQPHLSMELLKYVTGIDIVGVAYPGVAQAQSALLAGDVQLKVTPPMASDRTNELVVLSTNRSNAIPDVPAAPEAGVKDFFASTWLGLLAPIGTPKPVQDTLVTALTRILAEPETRAALLKPPVGVTPIENETPALFANDLAAQVSSWKAFIAKSGMKVD